jgi:hypothetical protein
LGERTASAEELASDFPPFPHRAGEPQALVDGHELVVRPPNPRRRIVNIEP